MTAPQAASTLSPDRPRLVPIVGLRSGRTTSFELLDGDALEEAAACAGAWRRVRPEVGLVVPLPEADPIDRLRHALDRAGLEPSAVAVEVPVAAGPDARPAIEALGVRTVLRSPGPDLDDLRRRSGAGAGAGAAMVKVPASSTDLGSAVAVARLFGEQVVVTGVRSIGEVGDAGRAGADAAEGAYLGTPLRGLAAVLAHLAQEGPLGDGEAVEGRVAGLEARVGRVEALVEELSGVEGRGAGPAAPRSDRSGPPGA